MVTRRLFTVVLVGVCALALAGCDWGMFGYGPAHTHDNPSESKVGTDNVNTLLTKWTAPTGDTVDGSPAVVNGVVYIGSDKVYAFDAVTGAQRWAVNLGTYVEASPAVVNGVVYVGADKLYALDATTGARLWSAPTNGDAEASPTVAGGVVYVGSDGGTVYAFDAAGTTGCSGTPKTCTPLWRAFTGGAVFASPAVSGGVVYVGSESGKFSAFDAAGSTGCSGTPKTCTPLWSAMSGGLGFSSAAVSGNVVYVAAEDGRLYAFDATGSTGCSGTPKTCTPLWSAPANSVGVSSPAVANGVVYVGSVDGRLYAFDATGTTGCSGTPKTCAPLWFAPTGGPVASSPSVANGVVYVGSDDGRLYAFDAAGSRACSGVPTVCGSLWTANASNVVGSSPAVADGAVYVGSGDGNVYAFELPKIFVTARQRHLPGQLQPGKSSTVSMSCANTTDVAVGGGFDLSPEPPSDLATITVGQNEATNGEGASATANPVEWTATLTNNGVNSTFFNTYVLCASAGSATVHVVQRIQTGGVAVAPGASGTSTATCQSGEVATGGGFVAVRSDGSIDPNVAVGQSEANNAASPTAWTVFATNHDTVNLNLSARVECATAGSTPLHVIERSPASVTLTPGASDTSTATCRNGEVATGGGFVARRSTDSVIEHATAVGQSEPATLGAIGPISWKVLAINNDTVNAALGARAMCLS